MSLTIDASVFVSAARPSEINYQASDDFLSALRRPSGLLYNPSLLLTETVASVTRQAGTSSLASAVIAQITHFPGMTLFALTSLVPRKRHESPPPAVSGEQMRFT